MHVRPAWEMSLYVEEWVAEQAERMDRENAALGLTRPPGRSSEETLTINTGGDDGEE